jgi:hypothetical protein
LVELERSAHEEKIRRLALRLSRDFNPNEQIRLKRLLLEEENGSGRLSSNLDMAYEMIRESSIQIDRQKELIDRVTREGRDTKLASSVLDNLIHLKELFEEVRDELLASLDRSKL